jgi:intracellular multiplication protein IcmE
MASKKENFKELMSNTKSRIVVIVTFLVLFLIIVVGFIKLYHRTTNPIGISSDVKNISGGISSVPGALNPTQEYAELQSKQNEDLAAAALKTGKSAIPTIIQSHTFGDGVKSVGPKAGAGSLDFSTLQTMGQLTGAEKNWNELLTKANCSRDSIEDVKLQGASAKNLVDFCSCPTLINQDVFDASIKEFCPCNNLKASGIGVAKLKTLNYTAGELKLCGFSACQLKDSGFDAQALHIAGFADDELKGAGFSEDEVLKASGLPTGVTAADIRKVSCNDSKKLRSFAEIGVSAQAIKRINGCTPNQLKASGFSVNQLKDAGYSAAELKQAGFDPVLVDRVYQKPKVAAMLGESAAEKIQAAQDDMITRAGNDLDKLKDLKASGISAARIKEMNGADANMLKAAGFTAKDLAAAGFKDEALAKAGFSTDEIRKSKEAVDTLVRSAGCDVANLTRLQNQGVAAAKIRAINGCDAVNLKAAGYDAKDLVAAGYSPAEIAKTELASAGQLLSASRDESGLNCTVSELRALRSQQLTAAQIKEKYGCSITKVKNAGYTPKELKEAGYSAGELKSAGFAAKEIQLGGYSPKDLVDSGTSISELKRLGYTAGQLLHTGIKPESLSKAGFSIDELKTAGVSEDVIKELEAAQGKIPGLSLTDSQLPGISSPEMNVRPLIPGTQSYDNKLSGVDKLADTIKMQQIAQAKLRLREQIQQAKSLMQASAGQAMQSWKNTPGQALVTGSTKDDSKDMLNTKGLQAQGSNVTKTPSSETENAPAIVKTGDIMFAVMDTSVNSDEPSPILATIVSGKFKGAKLIGSFNLPTNSDKLVISFNTISVPGTAHSTSINAYAIDPSTARTALSDDADHHYLFRYGSLFAATFLEGFGNAFQSANTQVVIGGTGGANDVQIWNGVNRSTLENAVIGLATLGKYWGQAAQQQFNRPTTVQVYSGTPIGVLFTQDLQSLN